MVQGKQHYWNCYYKQYNQQLLVRLHNISTFEILNNICSGVELSHNSVKIAYVDQLQQDLNSRNQVWQKIIGNLKTVIKDESMLYCW